MKKFLSIFIPSILIATLIGYVIYRETRASEIKKTLIEKINSLTGMIEAKTDSLSVYETLVDNYQFSERKLRADLDKINKDYSEEIKAQKSRVLSITRANLTLKGQLDTLSLKLKFKDNIITANIRDFYPDEKNPFVTYDATLQIPIDSVSTDIVVAREFSFSPIPINSVLTEKENGTWSVMFDAPDFIKVGNVDVKALPAKQFVPSRPRIKMVIGAGVDFLYAVGPTLHVAGGVAYGDWHLVGTASLKSTGVTLTKTFTR